MKNIKGYKKYQLQGSKVLNAKGIEIKVTAATGKYKLTSDAGKQKSLSLDEIKALAVDESTAKEKKPKSEKEKRVTHTSTIIDMWENKDMSVEDIVKKTGFPTGKVVRYIKNHDMRTLYHAGKPVADIAKKLGLEEAKVAKWVKRHFKK